MRRTVLALSILGALATVVSPPIAAQEGATVELLAPVLAAEDSRAFDAAVLNAALTASDSFVRSQAAVAIGRIGDLRGTAYLVRAMADPDTTVRLAAVFGLGLLRDTAAIDPILQRLRSEPVLDLASAEEAMTSLARIGGPRVGDIFQSILDNRIALSVSALDRLRRRIALEAWRLGRDAPVASLLPLTSDTSADLRWRAVFSLSRLRPVAASRRLVEALRDPLALTRSTAARSLIPSYVDSAGLGRASVASLLQPLLADADAGVRIAALRGIGALGDTGTSAAVVDRLSDAEPNVRVTAAEALGRLGGPVARAALERLLKRGSFPALDRAALQALARCDSSAAAPYLAEWGSDADWTRRLAAAQVGPVFAGLHALVQDRDPRVAAAALASWAAAAPSDPQLLAVARPWLSAADAVKRTVAAGIVGAARDPADIPALASAYDAARRDSFPDAALAALDALRGIATSGPGEAAQVTQRFLARASRPADYVIRAWADAAWPAASARWGPAYPLTTGRTMQDYREIVRRYMVAPDSVRRPHVTIETEQRGTIEVELLGPDAPLTVAQFLSLVDRHFFDGNRWHRVVPDFVVQDGDPRGDGWGSSGTTVRDEINRERYLQPMLGMALSGPDTGSSQWFINLSPQPHLDGTYTVFGKVVGSYAALRRITQGDVIRTIRR